MSEMDAEKEEAKKKIRSLLISAPVGLTLDELCNDYEEFMGSRLPTKKFGYKSDEDFLRDLSDVVRMSRGPKGNLVLTATADESTKHIAKMVSKQRVDLNKWDATSTRKARSKPRGGGGGGRGRPMLGRRPPPAARSADNRGPPMIPAFLQEKIQQFMNMCPGGVGLEHFEQAFYQKMGFRIELERAGFRDLQTFLSRVPHIVDLKFLPHGEVRVEKATAKKPPLAMKTQNATSNNNKQSKPLLPLPPSAQRHAPPRLSQQSAMRRNQSYSSQLSDSQQVLPRSNGCSAQLPQPRSRSRISSSASQVSSNSNNTAAAAARSSQPTHFSANSCSQPLSVTEVSYAVSSSGDGQRQYSIEQGFSQVHQTMEPTSDSRLPLDLITPAVMEEMCEVSRDLQNKIRQIMVMRPRGIWASRLPFDYKSVWKSELPYREQGYSSVIEFVSAMPHIVRVERPNPKGDWLLFDASMPAEKDKENVGLMDETELSIQHRKPRSMDSKGQPLKQVDKDEKLKESVRQVLQAHTDGVSLFHFKDMYEEMTGLRLDPEEYGMSDVHTLLISLTSDVLRIEYRGQNISHLFALPSPGICRFDYLKDCYKPHALEPEEDELYVDEDEEYDPRIPEDAVGPGACYSPVPLPRQDPSRADHSVDIHVSYIIDPGLFWIQRRGTNFNLALDTLMDSLEETYVKRGEDYRMPESLMTYGQVCATLFPEDNNWHRGIITGKNDVGMIQVYYVDYGNTCYVAQSSIRFLRKRFMKLPAQAIQARLAHVQPVGGEWAVAAKEEMLNIVRAKPMVALITNIKGRVLSLCLTDTSQANMDIHVNDLMVHKKYAVFVQDVYEEDQVLPANQLPTPEESFTQARSLASVAPVGSSAQRYVRPVDLTSDIGFHLINLQGCLYVMSSEVSALFWEDDILGSMLKQSNFNVSKLVVTRDQYPALFQELLIYGVPSIDTSTKVLSLYSFSGLPLILEIFGNASPAISELSEAILDIAKNFDPSDPYWKGHDEETVSLSQKSESTTDQDTDLDDILTMEELQMALRSLQILRKRILKRMTVEAVCTPSDITELEDTESNIKQTQALINTLQQSSASDVKLTPNGSVASSSGKSAVAKPIPTLPKKISSASGDIPACTVKMNVVAPMVQEKVTPALPIQEQTSVAQMAATNRQMEEIIKQQDQMLQSMLMMGWNPRLLNPGSASASPTPLPMAASSLGLESLGMRGVLEQPQIRSQIPAVNMGSGVPGTSDLHLPGMHPSVPVGNPPGLRMPTPPPPSSAPHGQVRAPGVGIPAPPGHPAALRMPSLLRPPVCSSLGYPLPVPPMYAQPLSPLQTSPLGALGTQSADGGSLGAPVMKGQAGLESGAGGQGFGSLQLPVAGSGSSLTQGELLPGLLPLLQSLKASCSVRPQVPSSSSQSRADNVQQ